MPKCSLIIRTRNEERWIGPCLRAVFDQTERDFEVILVDNESTDKTVAKAREHDVTVVTVSEYRPGAAINAGVRASSGEIIVCLSGHCIPASDDWLASLIAGFDDDRVAGVYGRQEPMAFTSDLDKRDLLITFGLDRRVQVKDSFFHNANSAIRRDVWAEHPFDEAVSNIEDRVWAEQIIRAGYRIVYEPEASVYHHHGIHQDADRQRCASIVRILETLGNDAFESSGNTLNAARLKIVGVVPVRNDGQQLNGRPLYEYAVEHARKSAYIDPVIVSTNDEHVRRRAIELGADVPFLRDEAHSRFDVILEQMMCYTLEQLENAGIYPDLLVMLEPTFPFRPDGLIDDMIRQLLRGGLDTVIPAREEFNSCWIENDGNYQRIDEGYIPRQFKKPTYTGIKGLCCVTHVAPVRDAQLFGEKVGIYKVSDPVSCLEVRSDADRKLAELIARNGADRGKPA